jgi:thioredoxin-related protein
MQEICVLQADGAVLACAMRLIQLSWLAMGCLCCSCGVMEKSSKTEEKPFGPTGIPQQLRANPEVDGPAGEVGVDAVQVSVALANHPTADNIIWTDPDAMDKNIPELQKLLAGPKREVWMKSEIEAKRTAIREGKCVLIWFTDSVRSPICKTLSEELFGQAEFGDWARDHTVRLIVDQSALMARGEKYDKEVSAQEYVEQMKKKYKALGSPTVIMLSPKGEVLAKYRGFKKGQGEFFWGQLKHSVNVGTEEYQVWMKKLEKQGYRRWESNKGQMLVARLISYHKGEMVMVEPDGNRFRTKESSLSRVDQEWIVTEKKKRGIE